MLPQALIFLLVATIAAAVGLRETSGVVGDMARVTSYVFAMLFFVALIVGRKVPPPA